MLSSEIFSASFVSFFTGIIIQFLPRDDFEESLNQAKQRLEVFVNGASQKMKRQESSATTWTNMSGATIHCNMDIFALIEHKGW
jgi:hypothetical protein